MSRLGWGVGLVLLLGCASHAGAQAAPPAPVLSESKLGVPSNVTQLPQTPPALSELQQCSVERLALQGQVVELRAQLVALQTQIDREALARERVRLEGTLPIAAGWRFDWQTLRLVPVTPEAPRDDVPR